MMCQVTSNFLLVNVQRINRKLEKKTGQVGGRGDKSLGDIHRWTGHWTGVRDAKFLRL